MAGILVVGAGAAAAQTTPDPHHPSPPSADKQAQPQPQTPGGMMGPGMMGPGMMGPGMMGRMMGNGQADVMAGCQMMGGGAVHTEGRVAFLRAELAITDAQKAVWDAYAAEIKKNLRSMQDMQKMMTTMVNAKTPLERIDARIAVMDKRAQALKEVKPALAALYAALSPEQKGKADQILTGMGCMM
jgi:predicted lipid-binding transport protein (Tim44 family)